MGLRLGAGIVRAKQRLATDAKVTSSEENANIHRSLTVAAPTRNGAATVRERWTSSLCALGYSNPETALVP